VTIARTLIWLAFTVLTNSCAFGQAPALPPLFGPHQWTASVKVIGEDSNPVVGATTTISYDLPASLGQSGKGVSWTQIKGFTDTDGLFSASHTDSSFGLGIVVEKAGFYTTHIGHQLYMPGQFDEKTVAASRNPMMTLVLKKLASRFQCTPNRLIWACRFLKSPLVLI
jgi:hypothetical protein